MKEMRDDGLNVVCLKWGTKYSEKDVNRLQRMVDKHLTHKHKFYCLTDNPLGLNEKVVSLPLDSSKNLTGWWYKLLFFQEKLYDLQGDVLFFDLDVVLTQCIDDLVTHKPHIPLLISQDWSYPQLHYGGVNSSIFRLKIGSMPHVWNVFEKNSKKIMYLLHGDQDWIDCSVMDYELYPKEWIVPFKSKECHSRTKSFGIVGQSIRKLGFFPPRGESKIPDGCKVVIFNGEPKPEDVAYKPYLNWKKSSWIVDSWQSKSY